MTDLSSYLCDLQQEGSYTAKIYYQTERVGCCGQLKLVHEHKIARANIHKEMLAMAQETLDKKDDGWKFLVVNDKGERIAELFMMEEGMWVYRDQDKALTNKNPLAFFNN